ncbi:hypothetical protein L9F63_002973, partial [Diploptera punctata]
KTLIKNITENGRNLLTHNHVSFSLDKVILFNYLIISYKIRRNFYLKKVLKACTSCEYTIYILNYGDGISWKIISG